MNNIWEILHELQDHELQLDLEDYTIVATNNHIIEALKEGLKDAQN